MIRQLFCKHNWETHTRETIEYEEKEIVEGTELWFSPSIVTYPYKDVTEILICKKCGKIKKIEFTV